MSDQIHAPEAFWSDPAARPTSEEWTNWKILFTEYLDLLILFNPSIKLTEEYKIKLLRQSLGKEGQRFFASLQLGSKTTLKDVFSVLDKHWSRRINVFVARYNFSLLKQEPGEPLDSFISRLTTCVRHCDYNLVQAKRIEEAFLLQRLVSGLSDGKLREILLTEDATKLTWDRACDMVRTKRDILDQNKMFLTRDGFDIISRVDISAVPLRRPTLKSACYRCGSAQHRANFAACPARGVQCHKCSKSGHFARVCRAQTVATIDTEPIGSSSELSTHTNNECIYAMTTKDDIGLLPTTEPKLPCPDIRTVYFKLEPVPTALQMELDSASPVTIVPFDFYKKKHLTYMPLQPSNYVFDSYSQTPVRILDFVNIPLSLDNTYQSTVAVYVSGSNTKPLLGRNAMVSLRISPSINRMIVASVNINTFKSDFPRLFTPTMGRIQHGSQYYSLMPKRLPYPSLDQYHSLNARPLLMPLNPWWMRI